MFRLGELFCGPGGLAWGATHADIGLPGFEIVHAWANDYDRATCDTYIRNICPDAPDTVICGDVRKLDIDSLGPIDALAFGFPDLLLIPGHILLLPFLCLHTIRKGSCNPQCNHKGNHDGTDSPK